MSTFCLVFSDDFHIHNICYVENIVIYVIKLQFIHTVNGDG